MRALLWGLVLALGCGPAPAPTRYDAGPSCDVGEVRACGCGLNGLDGVGVKRCYADDQRGVFELCRCDAGTRD